MKNINVVILIIFYSLMLYATPDNLKILGPIQFNVGGMNDVNSMVIPIYESDELLNVNLTTPGLLESRKGWKRKSLVTDKPTYCNVIENIYGSDTIQIIASGIIDNDTIEVYRFNDDDSAYSKYSLPNKLVTKGTQYKSDTYINSFSKLNNVVYYTDGINPILKNNSYDTKFYKSGIESPTGNPTLDSQSDTGGNMAPGYYRYLYKDEIDTDKWNYVESNPNDTYLVVNIVGETDAIANTTSVLSYDTSYHYDTTTNPGDTTIVIDTISYNTVPYISTTYTVNYGSCTIANICTSPNELVNKRAIYRTKRMLFYDTSLIVSYYLVGHINNNTDTTFYDNYHDTQIGLDPMDVNNNTVVPTGRFTVAYQNRLFVTGNDTNPYKLYVSGTADKNNFSYNFETYNPNINVYNFSDVGKFTAVAQCNGVVVLFTEKTMWALYIGEIEDRTTWRLKQIADNLGCINHFGIANMEGRLIIPTGKGLYILAIETSGEYAINSQLIYKNFGDKVENTYDEYIKNNNNKIYGFYDDFIYRLSYQRDKSYNNRELVFNTKRGIWCEHSGYYANCYVTTQNNNFYAFSSLPNGLVMELDEGTYNGDTSYSNIANTYVIGTDIDTVYFYDTDSSFDTLIDDYCQGQSFLYFSDDSNSWTSNYTIDNGTNYIVIPKTGDLSSIVDSTVLIGRIEVEDKKGWSFGLPEDFFNRKILRYLFIDTDEYSGDMDLFIYYDKNSVRQKIKLSNSANGYALDVDFVLDVTAYLDETGDNVRQREDLKPYTTCEKFKFDFYSNSKSPLKLFQWGLFYRPKTPKYPY